MLTAYIKKKQAFDAQLQVYAKRIYFWDVLDTMYNINVRTQSISPPTDIVYEGCIISPSGGVYVEQDALNFSGNQYVNTGIKPTNNTKIEIDFNMTAAGSFVFGSRTSNSSSDAFALSIFASSSYPMFGSMQSILRSTVSLNEAHHIVLGQADGFRVDDEQDARRTFETMSFSSNLEIYLGALNQNGTLDSRMFNGSIYSVKIYESNTPISEMIPCIRKPDNVYGIYDKIREEFYQIETA